jgi:hypothetical protein
LRSGLLLCSALHLRGFKATRKLRYDGDSSAVQNVDDDGMAAEPNTGEAGIVRAVRPYRMVAGTRVYTQNPAAVLFKRKSIFGA